MPCTRAVDVDCPSVEPARGNKCWGGQPPVDMLPFTHCSNPLDYYNVRTECGTTLVATAAIFDENVHPCLRSCFAPSPRPPLLITPVFVESRRQYVRSFPGARCSPSLTGSIQSWIRTGSLSCKTARCEQTQPERTQT